MKALSRVMPPKKKLKLTGLSLRLLKIALKPISAVLDKPRIAGL